MGVNILSKKYSCVCVLPVGVRMLRGPSRHITCLYGDDELMTAGSHVWWFLRMFKESTHVP